MIEFRAYNVFENDEDTDPNGQQTMACLIIDRIKIPLGAEYLDYLFKQIDEFRNTIFCFRCKYYIPSRWGYRYGGSCRKEAEEKNIEITKETIGYECSKGFMDTCGKGERKDEDDFC